MGLVDGCWEFLPGCCNSDGGGHDRREMHSEWLRFDNGAGLVYWRDCSEFWTVDGAM